MLKFPSRLSLAQLPTPLQPLDRLSEQLGGPRIWVKRDDLTGSHLSGNKIRKLEFVLARALGQGADTLITCGGTQSNHCRATAFAAAQLGLKCHLILRDDLAPSEGVDSVDGNLLLDHLAGAEVDIHPREGFARQLRSRLESVADEYIKQGATPYVIPVGASDGIGIWGYIAAAQELQQDFQRCGISPEVLVCASGSGGTQAGLTVGAEIFDLNTKVLGFAVCDSASYFQSKVKSDIAQWRRLYCPDVEGLAFDISVNDDYIGPGYAQADSDVLQTIADLARSEGLLLDPVYTGKAFHGLVEEIKRGEFADVSDLVFVHTGGIFGVFPWRQRFEFLEY